MNHFTEEQLAAISSSGKTIVSASAGSGKTTVMIEKIVRLIGNGTDVGEILAVTFTKKAAAQMKEKLKKELIKAINSPEASPTRRAELKRQLSEVPGADISTIHSFCSRLIRSHFFLAGVSGDFSVIAEDDADGAQLKRKALDEIFEEAYENAEPAFMRLLSVYWRKKSDNRLRSVISDTYSKLRMRADYRAFLREDCAASEEKFDRIAARLQEKLKEKCDYYAASAEKEKEYFQSVGREKSAANAEEVIAALKALSSARDYFSACAVPTPTFSDKERKKKGDSAEFSERVSALAALRDKTKAVYAELAKTGTREAELKKYLSAGEIAESLAEYILRFDERYAELKRERSLLDYNDLEHIALELLSLPQVQEEMRAKYRYVFVDEYQDVNPVQEKILSAVGGGNVFLVGDVKQSIYGFRGSKSLFFAEKQREFEREENASSLFLTRNFRSADEVLDAVNSQFLRAMTKENSDVDYADGSVMEKGGRYGDNRGRVRIRVLGKEEKKRSDERRGVYSVEKNWLKAQSASSAYAREIRHIIEAERNARYYDPDAGEFKRVEYSDIAVLSRKKSGKIEEVVAALSAEGIPVTASAAVNICTYPEIKTLIDILSLIDNAEQDIPLCSALLSAMGGLTADELSEIRLAYPQEKFFRNCCRKYAEEQGNRLAYRLREFYGCLSRYRAKAAVTDAGALISEILSETNMEARLLSRDNGAGCLRRIHRFIAETLDPEPLTVHDFLDRLRALGNKIEYAENGGENAVRVLTMHASKGLEYPIVILDDLSAPFHGEDRDEALCDEEFGIAPRCYDPSEMTVSETILRRLCEEKSREDGVKDELNLFYVALTRAKYGLYMLFTDKPAFPDVRYARSFADFTDFSVWEKYVEERDPFELPYQPRTAFVLAPDEELKREIVRAFSEKYPYGGGELPVKSSATAMMQSAEEGAFPEKERYAAQVLFDEEEGAGTRSRSGEGTSREAGLAYHAFLENFDFSLLEEKRGGNTEEDFFRMAERTIGRLAKEKLLPEDRLALLSAEKAAEILRNPVFSSLGGMKLYREQQFLVSLSAGEIYPETYSDSERESEKGKEEILFQGAIDLLAVGEEEVRIVDYKYSSRDAGYLKAHYAPQLALYKKAVARIMKLPPEKIRCTIVNIYLGFEVPMD